MMFGLLMPLALRYLGSPGRTIAEVTALDADRRVSWKAHMPSRRKGDLMRMSWEIELTPIEGGTQVVQRGVAAPPDTSPFARMANADMASAMQDEVAGNLSRLKDILESSL